MTETKRVFAIVVTYNRPDLLKVCIEALISQRQYGLSRIHIVVNSQDAETLEVIRSFMNDPTFLTYDRYNNPGPAGGFHYGLKRFIEEGLEYAWVMDDDIVVKDDCLQQLLICARNGDYLCPQVLSGSGKELGSFGWWGILLSKPVVERAGLPLIDLFFWSEDTEYLQHRVIRISKATFVRCNAAVVNHLHSRSHKRPAWYYYYVIRNTLYYRIYIVGFTWRRIRRTIVAIPTMLFRILLKEDKKLKKIKFLVYGIYHGLIGRIGKLIDPESNK